MDIDQSITQDEPEETNDPIIWSRYRKAERAIAVAANDGFVAAMNKAIGRKSEKVTPGTFIDKSPPIGAKRMYGIAAVSACGSPAAMCLDVGGAQAGAETMK